jgi:TolB-like protein
LRPSEGIVTDFGKAVFLSYASQDAEAASRVCEVLRAAGIEVWFDQSELRGGDAWDRMIRRQIKSCYLFVPIISANTQSREEGYFRREWKLGVDRTIDMAEDRAFLVPIVIDGTSDSDARVPEKFRDVQWTRLPGGETTPEFVRRIEQLLSGEVHPATTAARGPAGVASRRSSRRAWLTVAVVIAAVAAYLLVEKPWGARPSPPVAFAPPPHSIAVLPFVNLSGDKEQEYFSDGLTEELLNSLATIDALQVAARTSSFSFREHPDISTVAHKLNVAAVLEGSVRRSDHTVRVTAQLINAVTGFHLWSKTYDRDLGDVLRLQTEIATAVAEALKVTLLGDMTAKIELGGTRNPAAFDAYLRATKAYTRKDSQGMQDAIALLTEAIRLDPTYASAFAKRSLSYSNLAILGMATRESYGKALADAHQALTLVPDLPEGQLALAFYFQATIQYEQAAEAYARAETLGPGRARALGYSGSFAVLMGRTEPGLAALRRAVAIDPLDAGRYTEFFQGFYFSGRYAEAVAAATHAITLDPENAEAYGDRGLAYYGLGDFERARASCEAKPDYWVSQQCLAITYYKLGRQSDALAMLAKLSGEDSPYQYAEIYAQWGNLPKALEWLDTAMRLHDPGIIYLKTDPLMDPLRKEPRFEEIMRQLKFPQ